MVHHTTPHRGDQAIFWDKTKWASLCAEHHDNDAQQTETWGYSGRIGLDGMPTDPNHPFNRPDATARASKATGVEKSGPRGGGPAGEPKTELVSANNSQLDRPDDSLRERRGFQEPQASIGRPARHRGPSIDATPSTFRVAFPWE